MKLQRLVVAVIVLGVLLAGKEDCAPVPEVCNTKECISAANFILKNMDQSVDPCENFNLFSCGNFIKTSRIPDDASSVDTFTDLRNNLAFALSDVLAESANAKDSESTRYAKVYYQSCLDEATIEETGENQLVELINQVGGWHMIDNTLNVDSTSIYNRLVALRKLGTAPLFNVFVSASPKEPKKYLLRIQQPGVFYTEDKYADAKFATAYKALMKSIVNNLNTHLNHNSVTDEEIDQVYELEKELSNYVLTTAERRNQVYKNVTVAQLEVDYPGFQWVDYIVNGLYGETDKLREVNVTSEEPILIVDFRYFANFSTIYPKLVQEKSIVLDNFLMWSFIKSKTFYLPKVYRDAALEFDKVNSGTNAIPPRSRSCADDINNKMPYAVGRLYVQNNFDESAKQEASDMIENIRKEFKIIVNKNEWMDEKSKKNALDKADYIDVKVGFPDYTYNNTHLDSLYENYTFDVKTYLKNSMLTMRLSTEEAFLELREPRDPKDWISGPAIVNAFYSSSNNQITFPAGILQAPFYNAKVPKYLNYGGIGMVIGHEITHGFDDQGRKYDKDGIFFADGEEGLWTNKTIEEYTKKAQCIVNQYSNFVAVQVNRTLNGSQTLGENLADNGGIKESFYAYQKWVAERKSQEPLLPGLNYNQEQLFFINNAQVWCSKMTDQNLINRITTGVHSPGEFRIRGPTSNFAEFARVFKCKAGTNNNPTNKCTVW